MHNIYIFKTLDVNVAIEYVFLSDAFYGHTFISLPNPLIYIFLIVCVKKCCFNLKFHNSSTYTCKLL